MSEEPTTPAPLESLEDELTQAALGDPAAPDLVAQNPEPTLWRLVVVILFAVFALTVVFWRFR